MRPVPESRSTASVEEDNDSDIDSEHEGWKPFLIHGMTTNEAEKVDEDGAVAADDRVSLTGGGDKLPKEL